MNGKSGMGKTRQVGAALAAAVLAGAVAAAVPSQAAAVRTESVSAGDGTFVAGVPPTEVTLITGDTVKIIPVGDVTRLAVEPRADRDGFSYSSYTDDAGDLHVIPSDVLSLVGDELDSALFNVSLLARDGFDDSSGSTIPLIVEYADVPVTVPGTTVVRTLRSIDAAAITVERDGAGIAALGTTLARAAQARTSVAGVERIMLDARVRPSLDESVPQVGGDEIWDRGFTGAGIKIAIVDGGIDSGHPDLEGRIIAAANFSDSPTVEDKVGHGTHVASIAAGDGAASDGQYRGVAYEASLLNAKVLNDFDEGNVSTVIAGMEWAAVDQDADVINMSLNSAPTDGTDPVGEALTNLSVETDALFVTSAGNQGTVDSPATADAALAVGAVDKSDVLAEFSGVGPRIGRVAVKPEIVAPGVSITAARAEGTEIGPPVGEDYTTLDGTSMAAPHVTGAAALLLEAQPDLGWSQLKAALVTSAADLGYGVFQQGAGRLDIPAAFDQPVRVDTATIDLGKLTFPHDDGETVAQDVTLQNTGDADITVDLAAQAQNEAGEQAPDTMLSVAPASVTVPAGGTATVTVTFDPATGPYGVFGGILNARGDGANLFRVPLSFWKEVEVHTLTIAMTDLHGGDDFDGILTLQSIDTDVVRDRNLPVSGDNDVVEYVLPVGTYSAVFQSNQEDADGQSLVHVSAPEFLFSEDTTLHLDGTSTQQITAAPVEPSTAVDGRLEWGRRAATTGFGYVEAQEAPGLRLYANPTDDVTIGEYDFMSSQTLVGDGVSYHLAFPESGGIPSDLTYPAGPDDLALVDYGLHSDVPGLPYELQLVGRSSGDFFTSASFFEVPGGTEHQAWVSGSQMAWQEYLLGKDYAVGMLTNLERTYENGTTTDRSWYERPVVPGAAVNMPMVVRTGVGMFLDVQSFTDAERNYGYAIPEDEGPDIDEVRFQLLLDGEVVARGKEAAGVFFRNLPAERSPYQLAMQTSRTSENWLTSTHTETTWSFMSEGAAGEEEQNYPTLLQVDYDVDLDLLNRAEAPVPVRFDAFVPGFEEVPADVTSLQAWASFDDGDTWTTVPVEETGGSYEGLVDAPTTCVDPCYASLRVEVEGADGNGLEQTVTRAFVVGDGASPPPTTTPPTTPPTTSVPPSTTPVPTTTLPDTGGGSAPFMAGLGLLAVIVGGFAVAISARRLRA